MIRRILGFVSLVFTGLFAGFLLGILVLELSLRQFGASVYVQTQQVALVALPVLATALLAFALLAAARPDLAAVTNAFPRRSSREDMGSQLDRGPRLD